MKLFSIIALAATAALLSLSWTLAAVPIEAPLIIPLMVSAVALAFTAPAAWELVRLLSAPSAAPAWSSIRFAFPAPQTGQPQATASA